MKGLFILLTLCFCIACENVDYPKQVIRLNIFTEPPTLDPRKATDATSMNVLLNLFEGLTRIGEDHQPHAALAEKIEISNDWRTYTFTLRDAYWANGEKISAEDFVYTWQTILDPKFPSLFAYKLYVIENAAEVKEGKLPISSLGVRALDRHTLEVTLKHPTPYFLELTSFPTFFPINPTIDKKNPEWAAEAGHDYVSNGPFLLKKWEHESEIVALRNPLYWDAQNVVLEALHLAMVDDATTELYMFEMDELDWAGSPLSNLPPEFVAALKTIENETKVPICFYPATAIYYYKLNTLTYPLHNVSIRKALSYSVNRQEIVEHVTQAGQQPATSLIPPMENWQSRSLFEDANYQLAKQLFSQGLTELGITPNEFPVLKLSYNTNHEHQKIAEAIQNQWKKNLGIETELLHFDWKVYLAKISKQDYQIGRMGWIGDFKDPVSFLEPFKFKNDPEEGGNNDTGWEHPQFTTYLDLAEKEIDLAKRSELLQKAEQLFISEMPVIPIYFIVNGYLKKPYVKGVYLSSLGTADFKKAYIKK